MARREGTTGQSAAFRNLHVVLGNAIRRGYSGSLYREIVIAEASSCGPRSGPSLWEEKGPVNGMGNGLLTARPDSKARGPRKLLAKVVAAAAIALFWCISAVGTTIGTTVGVTSLATAVNVATSMPAEAGYRRGRRRRRRRRRWHRGKWHWYWWWW